MKHTLISIILIAFAVPSTAQWQNVGDGDLSGNSGGHYQCYAIGVHDSTVFLSDWGKVIRHMDTGLHPWVEADAGIDFSQGKPTSFTSLGSTLYVNIPNDLIYYSTNNGISWNINDSIGTPVVSDGTYLFADDPKGIARSPDNNKTWRNISSLSAIQFQTDGSLVLVVTNGGDYRSSDNGTSWATASPPSGLSLSAFTVIGTNIFAGGNGVFRSTDSGTSWTQVTTPPMHYPEDIFALASYKTFLFAGTDTGVFVSSDLGSTWRNVSQGMGGGAVPGSLHSPYVKILTLVDTMLWANVYVGQDQYGLINSYVTRRPVSEMIDSVQSGVQEFSSEDSIEIYPNPSEGTFKLHLAGTIPLEVRVLNVLGNKVLSVPKPNSDFTIDLSKDAPGTYFVQVLTTNGTTLKKIILER